MDTKQTGIQSKALHWYPGHMAKTKRLIEENLKLIDVVVEITDARIPYSGRNPFFNGMLRSKPRLIVMNKADMADRSVTDKWIEYFAAKGIKVIPISCLTGMGVNKIISEAEALVADRIKKDAENGRAHTLKLMMIGIPNVGKSSLINKLSGKAGTVTGNKPGVTKGKQWIRLKGKSELLDTPGILPQKFSDDEAPKKLAMTGAIKDDIINIELLSYDLIEYLRENYHSMLCERYKITEDISQMQPYEILELIGKKRGFVISGGETDTERAAKMLITELRDCKIGKISLEKPEDINKKSSNDERTR